MGIVTRLAANYERRGMSPYESRERAAKIMDFCTKPATNTCRWCRNPLKGRYNKITCSVRCRVALHRSKKNR